MENRVRSPGVSIIDNLTWGTHFGLFYRTKQDLIDILVPYFEEGLRNNEFCMWVTAEPLNVDDARASLAREMPDFNKYVKKGQIEIIACSEWYWAGGAFDGGRVLNGWVERLQKALERGFSGLRLTGNESWLKDDEWKAFIGYEQAINQVIGQYNMIALCAYPQNRCDANDVLDVVSTHQFILSKRNGEWKRIEDEGQKKARNALRESEAELARAQQIAHIGSWTWDVLSDEVTWSDESYRIYGLAPGEVRSTYELFLDFIVPEDREKVDAEVRKAIENGHRYSVEYRIVRRDGTPRRLLSENEVIRDKSGKVVKMYGTNQDITERKEAEDKIRENHRFTSVLLGNLPGMVFRCRNDENWTMEFLSPGCLKLTGYKVQDLFNNSKISYAQLIHPDDRERVRNEVQKAFHHKLPFVTNYRITTADGEEKWVWTQGRRLFSKGKEIIEGYAFDITDTKRAEEALLVAKAQAELYVDLMGHDINNMNQLALGYLELALQKLETDKNIKSDDRILIENPMQTLANSSALIKNVRKLQSLTTEGIKITPTDIDKIFRELEEMSFHSQDREVIINIPHVPGLMVEANELLKDAFVNLITNAIKHSDVAKPLTINVKVERVIENGSRFFKCMVEDNGPGIPDWLKDKLFNRFQRGATKAHGKGLGLYLVKTLADGYHGKVWVEDRVKGDYSKGARFVVMLPAAEQ